MEILQLKENHYTFGCLKKLYQYTLTAVRYHHLFHQFRVKKELVGNFMIHQNFWDIIFGNLTPQYQKKIFHNWVQFLHQYMKKQKMVEQYISVYN